MEYTASHSKSLQAMSMKTRKNMSSSTERDKEGRRAMAKRAETPQMP